MVHSDFIRIVLIVSALTIQVTILYLLTCRKQLGIRNTARQDIENNNDVGPVADLGGIGKIFMYLLAESNDRLKIKTGLDRPFPSPKNFKILRNP